MSGMIMRFVSVVTLLFSFNFSLIAVSHAGEPKRIVSLAPSVTEILYALHVQDRVAGVTSFCDYPEEAKQKPKIGGLSNPSLEAVVSLRPDLVLMTMDGNPKTFEERLRSMNIRTVVLKARRISDLPDGIRQVGAAVGAQETAERLAADIDRKIRAYTLRGKTIDAGHKGTGKPKVLFIIWPEPLIVAGPGTTTDEALNMLGVVNIASAASAAYPKYSIEEILRQAPDVIFIGKGNGMDKVADNLLSRLKKVPAVKNGKVFYVSDYLYRLGPRTINGVDELAVHLQKP